MGEVSSVLADSSLGSSLSAPIRTYCKLTAVLSGAGFVINFRSIIMRSLGWKRVHNTKPQAWIMSEEVASLPVHAGSTYAELNDLEQRTMKKCIVSSAKKLPGVKVCKNQLRRDYIAVHPGATEE